jgi:hypothetical protein
LSEASTNYLRRSETKTKPTKQGSRVVGVREFQKALLQRDFITK